jgi:hypothetical protein
MSRNNVDNLDIHRISPSLWYTFSMNLKADLRTILLILLQSCFHQTSVVSEGVVART